MTRELRPEDCCCKDLYAATRGGTDNEGWGSVISPPGPYSDWCLGCNLPEIKFCPWCGKLLPKRKDVTGGRL